MISNDTLVKTLLANESLLTELIPTLSEEELGRLFLMANEMQEAQKENPLLFFEPSPGGQTNFNASAKKILFMFGGNSAGKTYAGMKRVACFAQGCDPSETTPLIEYPRAPTRGWFGADSHQKAWAMVFQTLMPLLPNGYIVKADYKLNMLFFKDGSWLGLKSFKSPVDAWGSEELNYIYLDEQPPHAHFVESQSRVNRVDGSIWCTMTPERTTHPWTYRIVYMNEENNPEIEWHTADMDDNRYLSAAANKRFHDSFDGTPQEDSKIHGRPSVLKGLVHPTFDERIHVIRDFDIRAVASDFEFARVIDFHGAKDVVGNLFMFQRRPKPVVYVVGELIEGGHIAVYGKNMIDMCEGLKIKFTILDTPESKETERFGTNSVIELANIGIPTIESYQFRDMFSGIDRLNQYLDSGTFYIFESCRQTISSVGSLMWKAWSNIEAEEDARDRILKKNEDPARNIHMFLKTMPSLNEDFAEGLDNTSDDGYDTYLESGHFSGD